MIYALCLLASLSFAQSSTDTTTSPIDAIRLSNINKGIRELQSGRPQITGIPKYINGLSVGSAGITWADGTTSTTSTGGWDSVHQSSYTSNMAETTMADAGVCAVGSTVTYSCPGSNVRISFSGSVGNDSDNNISGVMFMVDGAFPSPYGATSGVIVTEVRTHIYAYSASFGVVLPIASGQHSYCLTAFSQGGAKAVIPSRLATLASVPQFGIECLP